MGMILAASSNHADAEPLMEVNTTPLIDVMLVLLVMLIITIPMQLHSMDLFMDSEVSLYTHEPVIHTVSIDFDGTVDWDGDVLASRAAIDAKMNEVGTMAASDQPEVHIKANPLADYGLVAAVMTSAQRHSVKNMAMVGINVFDK